MKTKDGEINHPFTSALSSRRRARKRRKGHQAHLRSRVIRCVHIMTGTASARRDTPAARAALARRRQRAAQALKPQQQPKNTAAPASTTSKETIRKPSSLRVSTNTASTTSNSNVKLSPLAQRAISKHISSPSNETSDGTLTTAAMTTESSFMTEYRPRAQDKAQNIIHYKSKQKISTEATDGKPTMQPRQERSTQQMLPSRSTAKATARVPVPPSRSNSSGNILKPVASSRGTPRTSAALSTRLSMARFRSQSPSTRIRVPSSTVDIRSTSNTTGTRLDKKQTSAAPTTKPISRPNHRVFTKPPALSTKHVANQTTTTAYALASSPTRAALRSRMQPTTSNSMRQPSPSRNELSANNSPRKQPPSPMKREKTVQSPSQSLQKKNHPSPSQRMAQQAQAKYNVRISSSPLRRNTPQRTPHTFLDASFADVSTILDQTLPPLDDTPINKSTILDRTLPPLNTPAKFVSPRKAVDESVLLEEYYQHTQQSSSGTNDAACLEHQSTVLLRSCASNTTIQAILNNTKENGLVLPAEPSGLCLGRSAEVLTINKVTETSSNLRHGDHVQLVFQESFSLGVKKCSTTSKLELGFYHKDAIGGKSDHHWTILIVKPRKKVLVGRAAVAADNRNNNSPATNGKVVSSGDPILLRHVPTGGVLSVKSAELKLVTDSYASQQAQVQDPSLIERLQHHDQLLPSKDEVFQLILSSTPPCPQWLTTGCNGTEERIFLTGSYLLKPNRHPAEVEFQMSEDDRQELSSSIEESILIDEVIGSFLGLEGRHIKVQPSSPTEHGTLGSSSFKLVGTDQVDFDRSLRNLVEQILPMSTSYVRVQHFISSHHPGYEFGRVMHAFCEGLDALLQDYVNFVVQMERQHRKYKQADSAPTMKSIYFQITPSLHSMSILEHATRAVQATKGGALINALWSLEKLVYMGDMVAKKVLGILLEKSSIPYVEMMSAWLQSGRLSDPYQEFMVQRTTEGSNASDFDGDDWMAVFTVNDKNIIEGVTSDKWTKEKLLTTGKYWNAVHACRVNVEKFHCEVRKIPKIPFNSDSSEISSYIDTMYQNASRVLVKLLKDDFQLKESLLVMKRYFLLDQGDLVTNFLDRSEEELRKPSKDVSVSRVQNWLNLSIQLTEGHREDAGGANDRCPLIPRTLRCRFSGNSLVSHLDSVYGGIVDRAPLTPSRQAYGMSKQGNTGIEVFAIDFPQIPFPISLILSQHAMDKYKLLFRHLFFTKHVERRLIGVWRDHQVLKKLDALRGLLGPTFLLRQRMLHFVQNLLYFMSFEVIDNNFSDMISAIDKSNNPMNHEQQTVDDILNVHSAFLQNTLQSCLLTNRELIRSLTKLLNTCLLFTDQMKRFMDTTKIVSCDKNSSFCLCWDAFLTPLQ